jgi:serine/threonine-protein kinase RsbW
VEIEFPARTDYVSLARVVVAAVAGVETGFSDASIDDLRVAVSEATTNAVEATIAAATSDRVRLECRLLDDRLEVQVTDHGQGFEVPGELTMPELDEEGWLPDGGFGLPLMMLLADEHEFDAHDDGTRVTLVKYVDHVM